MTSKSERYEAIQGNNKNSVPSPCSQRQEDGRQTFVTCALLGDANVGKTSLVLSYAQNEFSDEYSPTVFENYSVPVQVGGGEFVLSLFDTCGDKSYESLRAYMYENSEVLVVCFSIMDRHSFLSVLNTWLPEMHRHSPKRRALLLVGTRNDARTPLHTGSASSSYPASYSSFSSSSSSSSAPSSSSASSSSSSSRRTSTGLNSTSSFGSTDELLRSTDTLLTTCSSPASRSGSSISSPWQDEVSTEEGEEMAEKIGADCYIECSARSQEGLQRVLDHVVFSALKQRAMSAYNIRSSSTGV